jgi:photosystem II stability/assembly factor-like uncharacterized protein
MKAGRMPLRLARFVAIAMLLVPTSVAATTLFGLVDTGELFVSSDQGINWTIRSTLPVRDAVALGAGANTSELYLASASGVVYRSTDAGMNWSAVGTVSASDAVDLLVAPDLALLLLTATGSLYKSNNQGVSFTAIAALTGSDFVSLTLTTTPAVRYYALSRSGGVYESTDGGTSWTPKGAITLSSAVELRAIGSTLYAMSAEGDIFLSSDAGVNWTPVGTLSQSGMTSLARDGTTLVASTSAGEVATSGDGANWTWQGVINQLTVIALGTDAPATTGVEPGLTAGLHLSPPWPNPTRGAEGFSLTLRIPAAGRARLELMDVAGRRVASRSMERSPAGASMIHWAPQVPAAGLYMIRLSLGGGAAAEARVVVIP